MDRDEIEAGADLTNGEVEAAKNHLRAKAAVSDEMSGCTSYLQRKMGIGYNHAARIMELLELDFITAPNSRGNRTLK